jgi:hypothetical protein
MIQDEMIAISYLKKCLRGRLHRAHFGLSERADKDDVLE